MTCCNQNCNQGRNCPNRKDLSVKQIYIIIGLLLSIFWFSVINLFILLT